jgi:hypothetical protein
MKIEMVKDRVADACMLLGGGLPYDPDSIHCDDWESLADYLADVARHIQSCCARIAGYAGYAQREANRE